jgi:predicted type IV restriction endonuclease
MRNTPTKPANRIASALRAFKPIVESAKKRDLNESDTVTVVIDLLSEMLGYDKYSEITSEVAIRGAYCDLATKIDGKVQLLLEVKAVGGELKENHTRQAVDYAASEGVDWVVLTNAATWKVYRLKFGKPVCPDLVLEFNFLELEPKNDEHIAQLFLISKEGFERGALKQFDAERQAINRFSVAALVLSDLVVSVIRRELRKLSPDVSIEPEQVRTVLQRDVLKRDVLEDDRAVDARRKLSRALARMAKAKNVSESLEQTENEPIAEDAVERPKSTGAKA